jgi:hypothetical protein
VATLERGPVMLGWRDPDRAGEELRRMHQRCGLIRQGGSADSLAGRARRIAAIKKTSYVSKVTSTGAVCSCYRDERWSLRDSPGACLDADNPRLRRSTGVGGTR